MNVFLFLFLMSSMEDERYFLLLLSSSMEEKRRLLKNPSSSMEDEHSFYIFYLLPWKTSVLFLFYYLRPWATSVLFLFSANPMLQRRSFSSIGLISNAHRVERSTSFLIMKKHKSCRWPRPYGDCSCLTYESIARQRQRICRAIARRLHWIAVSRTHALHGRKELSSITLAG